MAGLHQRRRVNRRSAEEIEKVVDRKGGIISAIAGILTAFVQLIPYQFTWWQRILAFMACLTLAAAVLAALGAAHSRRRMALTCALLVVTLGSVVGVLATKPTVPATASKDQASPSATLAPSPIRASPVLPAPSAVPSVPRSPIVRSPAPSQSRKPAGPKPSPSETETGVRYLSDMQPARGGLLRGTWQVGGKRYEKSLGIQSTCSDIPDVVYDLDGSYERFQVVIGKAAASASGPDSAVEFRVNLDEDRIATRNATAEHPDMLDLNVKGGKKLTLWLDPADCTNGLVVWGSPRLS
jgi:hypothetical protein